MVAWAVSHRQHIQTPDRAIICGVGLATFTAVQARKSTPGSFHDWLPRFAVHTLIGRAHGQWYALATDFSVVGTGATEQDARGSLSGALETYLRDFYERGESIQDAVHPVGLLTRVRLFLSLDRRKRQLLFPGH